MDPKRPRRRSNAERDPLYLVKAHSRGKVMYEYRSWLGRRLCPRLARCCLSIFQLCFHCTTMTPLFGSMKHIIRNPTAIAHWVIGVGMSNTVGDEDIHAERFYSEIVLH